MTLAVADRALSERHLYIAKSMALHRTSDSRLYSSIASVFMYLSLIDTVNDRLLSIMGVAEFSCGTVRWSSIINALPFSSWFRRTPLDL
jgi:hypothetical protein